MNRITSAFLGGSFLVALLVGVVAGWSGLGWASAGVTHSHLYTHSSSSCTGHVDPINVVFYESGFSPWVDNHAGHHGGWGNNDSSDQWFKAHICKKHDATAASNSGIDPGGRYHMRIGDGWNASGGYDFDNSSFGWHVWSTADAHHEDSVWCGFNPFSHAVDDNVQEPPGGFNRGQSDVWKNWTGYGILGPHYYAGGQDWSNTARFTQCNGNVAWSSGIVDFVKVTSFSGH